MTAVTMEELAVYLEEIVTVLHTGLVMLGAYFLYMAFFRRR